VKFEIDENLLIEIVDEIRGLGHEADTVIAEGLRGFVDPEVLAAAKTSGRVLLTMDKGMANVRLRPPEQFQGIVLFRPKRAGRRMTFEFVRRHLPALLTTGLSGRLVVVSDAGIRIR
jgi:predicted nuclease of predicted toxin-antitoxin system